MWRYRRRDIEVYIDSQIAQSNFARKAKKLWKDIQDDLEKKYTVEDVPQLIQQVCDQQVSDDA